VCERVLHRRSTIPFTLIVFDVLNVECRSVMRDPYSTGRRMLEEMQLAGPGWRTPDAFDDGATLWDSVCGHELKGVVAKRGSCRYVCGVRGWCKTKYRDYWRYELGREAFMRRLRSSSPPACDRSSVARNGRSSSHTRS
jgi:ATP-dependent DNA ligase